MCWWTDNECLEIGGMAICGLTLYKYFLACMTQTFLLLEPWRMDSSTTVNHDHLKPYMVCFNPLDKRYIVRWQSDLANTKESILPVCDKPFHKIKENMLLGEELEKLWNYPLTAYELLHQSILIHIYLKSAELLPLINKKISIEVCVTHNYMLIYRRLVSLTMTSWQHVKVDTWVLNAHS